MAIKCYVRTESPKEAELAAWDLSLTADNVEDAPGYPYLADGPRLYEVTITAKLVRQRKPKRRREPRS